MNPHELRTWMQDNGYRPRALAKRQAKYEREAPANRQRWENEEKGTVFMLADIGEPARPYVCACDLVSGLRRAGGFVADLSLDGLGQLRGLRK